MAECSVCGKPIVVSCAEERSRNLTCFVCSMKIEADIKYKHDPTIRALVDALRLCAASADGVALASAERVLEYFGGLNG
jgi:transcription elongation factor Elf1